jgi:8-oxo-dGTP pyrophosphatase MutT (NUDIX family)
VTLDDLSARLRLIAAEPHTGEIVYGDDRLPNLETPPVPAAVLVPVVLGAAPGILLTKRTAHLKAHAGQVSFPGGRSDPGEQPEETALREAQEEIALDRSNVQVLGRMSNYLTRTGFCITPVVALLQPGLQFRPSPHEVDAVFELPLDVLLDPKAPERRRREEHGSTREFWVWPHPQHCIWGAAAAILGHLAEKLRALC